MQNTPTTHNRRIQPVGTIQRDRKKVGTLPCTRRIRCRKRILIPSPGYKIRTLVQKRHTVVVTITTDNNSP
ncbi:hypothetical protein HanRHA438_Chr03g0133681 [Helianthus annuus]|nr:hypothetical protein HanRHA438_Chr03g0133681 [Helianthus annuus]